MKACPACAEEIQNGALVCKHCGTPLCEGCGGALAHEKVFRRSPWSLAVVGVFALLASSVNGTERISPAFWVFVGLAVTASAVGRRKIEVMTCHACQQHWTATGFPGSRVPARLAGLKERTYALIIVAVVLSIVLLVALISVNVA